MLNNQKKCKRCNTIKNRDEFYKRTKAIDGLREWCIICDIKQSTEYSRTKKGLIKKIYRNQKENSKRRGNSLPNYTEIELSEWLRNQDLFHELYYKWVESGYKKMLVPSCDRHSDTELDYDYKPYCLTRLRICTWEENKKKLDEDRKNGINNKKSRAVNQLNKDGNFIESFFSMANASKIVGVQRTKILECCKGTRKTCGGFKWEYADA